MKAHWICQLGAGLVLATAGAAASAQSARAVECNLHVGQRLVASGKHELSTQDHGRLLLSFVNFTGNIRVKSGRTSVHVEMSLERDLASVNGGEYRFFSATFGHRGSESPASVAVTNAVLSCQTT